MADETKTETADKPLANLADAERAIDPPVVEQANITAGPEHLDPFTFPAEPVPATSRIRAFEDEHLGPDAVRIGGRVERGSGSPFASLSDEHKRQYAALEKLVEAEQKLDAAHTALIQADAEHDAALAAVEPKPDAA